VGCSTADPEAVDLCQRPSTHRCVEGLSRSAHLAQIRKGLAPTDAMTSTKGPWLYALRMTFEMEVGILVICVATEDPCDTLDVMSFFHYPPSACRWPRRGDCGRMASHARGGPDQPNAET